MTIRIYTRRSKNDEGKQQYSLDVQQAGCRDWLAGRGFAGEVVAYVDDGKASDEFLNRTGLRKLLADAKPGDVVVCRDQSRLGRDAIEVTLVVRDLVRDRGCRLFYYVNGQEVQFANAIDPRTRALYEQQFKIQFVDEGISAFVAELHKRCGEKNLLRQTQAAATDAAAPKLGTTPEEIMDLVAYDKTRLAIESLRALLSPARNPAPRFREHEIGAVMLMSQFENLERKAQAGTLYTQEDNVERAKITYNLISLINGVREAMSM